MASTGAAAIWPGAPTAVATVGAETGVAPGAGAGASAGASFGGWPLIARAAAGRSARERPDAVAREPERRARGARVRAEIEGLKALWLWMRRSIVLCSVCRIARCGSAVLRCSAPGADRCGAPRARSANRCDSLAGGGLSVRTTRQMDRRTAPRRRARRQTAAASRKSARSTVRSRVPASAAHGSRQRGGLRCCQPARCCDLFYDGLLTQRRRLNITASSQTARLRPRVNARRSIGSIAACAPCSSLRLCWRHSQAQLYRVGVAPDAVDRDRTLSALLAARLIRSGSTSCDASERVRRLRDMERATQRNSAQLSARFTLCRPLSQPRSARCNPRCAPWLEQPPSAAALALTPHSLLPLLPRLPHLLQQHPSSLCDDGSRKVRVRTGASGLEQR